MGATGGEGFTPPFRAAGLQGAEGDHIGSDEDEEDSHTHHPTVGDDEETQGAGVHEGQFQQGSKSHIKWSIVSGPQKGVRHMKRSCTVVWINPPPRPLPATGSMPEVS